MLNLSINFKRVGSHVRVYNLTCQIANADELANDCCLNTIKYCMETKFVCNIKNDISQFFDVTQFPHGQRGLKIIPLRECGITQSTKESMLETSETKNAYITKIGTQQYIQKQQQQNQNHLVKQLELLAILEEQKHTKCKNSTIIHLNETPDVWLNWIAHQVQSWNEDPLPKSSIAK